MAAQPIFITAKQLEGRIPARTLARILDDNRDGSADEKPSARLRADASSKVASYLAPLGLDDRIAELFHETTGELLPNVQLDPEVVRLTLDVAEAMVARRGPTIMQADWFKMMEAAEKDLGRLRDGKTTLLSTTRPHAANHGAYFVPGQNGEECLSQPNVSLPAPPGDVVGIRYVGRSRFWDDTGDF